MASSKLIQMVAKREKLTEQQADFLEGMIIAVRQDRDKVNPSGVENVVSKLLDDYIAAEGAK